MVSELQILRGQTANNGMVLLTIKWMSLFILEDSIQEKREKEEEFLENN